MTARRGGIYGLAGEPIESTESTDPPCLTCRGLGLIARRGDGQLAGAPCPTCRLVGDPQKQTDAIAAMLPPPFGTKPFFDLDHPTDLVGPFSNELPDTPRK